MSLPDYRQLFNGRTFSSSWDPSEISGIEPPPPRRTSRLEALYWIASGLLIFLALTAPHWWPK